jgi:hypothetical protein
MTSTGRETLPTRSISVVRAPVLEQALRGQLKRPARLAGVSRDHDRGDRAGDLEPVPAFVERGHGTVPQRGSRLRLAGTEHRERGSPGGVDIRIGTGSITQLASEPGQQRAGARFAECLTVAVEAVDREPVERERTFLDPTKRGGEVVDQPLLARQAGDGVGQLPELGHDVTAREARGSPHEPHRHRGQRGHGQHGRRPDDRPGRQRDAEGCRSDRQRRQRDRGSCESTVRASHES